MAGVLSTQAEVGVPSFRAAPAPRFALGYGVVLALFATSPLWLGAVGLYQYLALEVLIWSLYALGYNLLLGYGGLPSFGHGAFFGIGAYAAGLALKHADVGLIGGHGRCDSWRRLFGALVAAFISHRRGIYYALMTIAFGQLAWFVSIKWHSVTGGEDGLLNVPRPPLDLGFVQVSLTSHAALFYFALALFAVDCVGALVPDRHAVRTRARCGQAERDARGVLRTQRLARQVHRVRDVVRDRRAGRRPVRTGAAVGVSERDESE